MGRYGNGEAWKHHKQDPAFIVDGIQNSKKKQDYVYVSTIKSITECYKEYISMIKETNGIGE